VEQRNKTGNEYNEKPYQDPFKNQDRNDLGQKANEIEAYRKKVKGKIETALNQDPKITSEELEISNRN